MTDRKKILLALHEDGIGALTFGFYIVRGFLKDNEGIELTVRRQGRMHVFQEWVNKYHQDEGWKGPKPHLELVDNLITIPKDKGEVDCRETIKKLRSYPRQSLDYRARPLSSDWDLIIDFGVPTIAALAASAKTRNVTICDLAWGLTLSRITEECGAVTTERWLARALNMIKKEESSAEIAYLFPPYLTPDEFEDHWTSLDVPVKRIEGVFGGAPSQIDLVDPKGSGAPKVLHSKSSRKEKQVSMGAKFGITKEGENTVNTVLISGGGTGVWDQLVPKIIRAFLDREKQGKLGYNVNIGFCE